MRSRSQGGVHTSLTRTSLTPGTAAIAFSISPGMLCATGQAGVVKRHLDKDDAALLDQQLIDQSEIDDVDRDFRVADGLQRLEHRLQQLGIVFALRPLDVFALRRLAPAKSK